MAKERLDKVAVVTGTTRDVGEFLTYGLAQAGWDILGLYRNPKHTEQQEAMIKKIIKEYKVKMSAEASDLTNPDTPNLVIDKLDKVFGGKVNALVLNASGGYKQTLEDAREINIVSQVRLVDQLLDRLVPGSVIVYNTSDPSHRFKQLVESEGANGDYYPVAKTKNEMENLLRLRVPEFLERQIRLAVVVGNALDGTFVSRALNHREKAFIDQWRSYTEEGYFPTAIDMATACLKVIRGNHPSGHTEYVGLKPEQQLYPASKG